MLISTAPDLCAGIMSFERTLIPVTRWTSDDHPVDRVEYHRNDTYYEDYAKLACNLAVQAVDLFASYKASEGQFGGSSTSSESEQGESYTRAWSRLWDEMELYFVTRPAHMQPMFSIPGHNPSINSPFPNVIYSNAAAQAGNQWAHCAAILMLQRKPRDLVLKPKTKSILWHARQICGIALSNDHHGCWTNAVQPMWIAGRLMSHPQEHEAILHWLRKVERETGWATQFRVDDLTEHWGSFDD